MAITKIHPIKSTLHLAINYIVNGDKTDEQLLVSTRKCHESSAHTQFLRTRKAITKSVIKVISCAKKTSFPSSMNTTKAIRKNTRQAESLGMKTNRQSVELLGKAGCNLILTEW